MVASGGPQSGWASPATLASTFLTLLIGEAPSHPAFDGTRAAGIWSGSLAFGQQPTTFTRIAETTQASLIPGATGSCVAALNQCWDIGDITEAESFFGAGKWIVTIRAHTLPFRATGFD